MADKYFYDDKLDVYFKYVDIGTDPNTGATVYAKAVAADIVVGDTIQLAAGVASVGTVGLDAGVASVGTVGLNTGANTIGKVDLNAGANTIGKVDLNAGSASVGTVGLNTGANTIGKVDINAGANTIGKVDVNAGANTIGKVDLNAGANTIGKVDVNASELHIGNVGGEGITISQTPTVTVGAYSEGDAVGGLLTFANAARVSGGGGVIKNVLLIDDVGQDVDFELWLFDRTFTAMVDNAAWAPSEADLRNLIGIVYSTNGAWAAAGTPSINDIEVSKRYDLTGTSMFGQLVTRGTPTFSAADDVTVKIGLLQD